MSFRSLCVSIACIGVSAFPIPASAYPVLTFSVASHVEPPAGNAQAPTGNAQAATDESFPLIVTLGRQFLAVEAKGSRTIYDFENYRIYSVDLQAKSFEDDSLYSNIGFRVLEFYNRIGIGTMLRSADLKGPSTDIALVEHLFSLTDPKSSTVIDARKVSGATEYRWQQHLLMTVSDRDKPIPAGYQAEYWRFLRYYAGGHPRIFASLSAIKGVPEKIALVLSHFSTETRSLTLRNIAALPDAPYSLDGFTRTQPDREPYRTLKLIAADAPQELQARVGSALQDRDSAFAQGRYFDAFLASQEMALSTGDMDGDWLRSNREKLNGDALVARVAAALRKHDASQAPVLADELASVRALAASHAEVLEIFEGNTRLEARQSGGVALLLSAVRADPYLAGGWHDLGDYYYRSFHMQEAWACLDAARRIAPRHPLLQPVNDLERTLRAKNPEFF